MAYYKFSEAGFIVSICSSNTGDGNISLEEYEAIKDRLTEAPKSELGYVYKLRESDLEWEKVKYIPPEYPYEPTDYDKAEAYDILMGVSE